MKFDSYLLEQREVFFIKLFFNLDLFLVVRKFRVWRRVIGNKLLKREFEDI